MILRPLEWLKNRYLPRRSGTLLQLELAEGASAGGVLESLEGLGRVAALRRDGERLQVEFVTRGEGPAAVLAAATELPGVREARWA